VSRPEAAAEFPVHGSANFPVLFNADAKQHRAKVPAVWSVGSPVLDATDPESLLFSLLAGNSSGDLFVWDWRHYHPVAAC
jgi:hypothetical protein